MISAIRSSRSGTTLIRVSRLNVWGSIRSAVPAQLLLTVRTSRVAGRVAAWAGDAARAARASATVASKRLTVGFNAARRQILCASGGAWRTAGDEGPRVGGAL